MKVKHVFIRNPQSNRNPLAYADIMFGSDDGDGLITVRGWKLMKTEDNFWVGTPSQKGKDGEWYPQVSFAKKDGEFTEAAEEFKNHITREVLSYYKKSLAAKGEDNQPTSPPKQNSSNMYKDDFGFGDI